MADIAESATFTDPAVAILQGKRHLLVQDYTMAAGALARACQLLAEKHGDTADELGEPYLLYGRALLGLAREEAGVLGGGVPGTDENNDDDDDEEEDGEDEKLSNVDEKEEEEEEEAAEAEGEEESGDAKSKEAAKKAEAEKTDDEKSEVNKKEAVGGGSTGKEDEENRTDDSKIAEQKAQESKPEEVEEEIGEQQAVAGSSRGPSTSNGPSSSTQNGDARLNGDDGAEDVSKDDDDEEANNLQVAWEVLELAKLVLLKRGEAAWKLLADAYRLLGEVAMEGGNHQGALNDLQGCLELLEKIVPRDARAIAEIHYQLALAHSLGNEFDASIQQFTKATELLEARIEELEGLEERPKTNDVFYTVEGEIKELKELLPEIQEKITDMKDFKEEACRLVIEGIKSKVAGGCSNGAGPSGAEGSSSSSSSKVQAPASDISHLVRKKRKSDEPEAEAASPCKKPTPEKAV